MLVSLLDRDKEFNQIDTTVDNGEEGQRRDPYLQLSPYKKLNGLCHDPDYSFFVNTEMTLLMIPLTILTSLDGNSSSKFNSNCSKLELHFGSALSVVHASS